MNLRRAGRDQGYENGGIDEIFGHAFYFYENLLLILSISRKFPAPSWQKLGGVLLI